MNIIVVEDFKVMREILVAMLEQLGHEIVAEFDSMAQAMSLEADFIICELALASDYFRENRSGPTSGSHCRSQILLMGYDSERAQMQEALGEGVCGFIVKPFTLNGLSEKIKRLTSNRRAS